MTVALILLVLGAVLLCIEMFFPGFGVFGVCGIIAVIISAVLAFFSGPFGAMLVLSEMTLLAVFVFVTLNYVKKRQLGKLVLNDTLDLAQIGNDIPEDIVGKRGVVVTPLRPLGTVEFDGLILEAFAESGFVKEDRYVKVTRVENNKIFVRALEQ